MNQIQLDEDCDAKHLVKACEAEGKVKALRLPRALRRVGTKDPAVLQSLIPKANPILTLDQGFADEHPDCIPDSHAGILILAHDPNAIPTFTTHAAQSMLASIKCEVPDWHMVDLSNSIVLMRTSMVEISHCESGRIVLDRRVDRTSAGWEEELKRSLADNACRGRLP